MGGKKKAGRERGVKQMEGINFSHLSAKLSDMICDVFFVSVVVFLQHSAQRSSVFCCHQSRHVTQRIAELSKEPNFRSNHIQQRNNYTSHST